MDDKGSSLPQLGEYCFYAKTARLSLSVSFSSRTQSHSPTGIANMAPTYSRSCERTVLRRGGQSEDSTFCSLPLYQKLSDHRSAQKARKRMHARQTVSLETTKYLISVLNSLAYTSCSRNSLPPISHPTCRIASWKVNRSTHRNSNLSKASKATESARVSHTEDSSL